VKPNLKDKVLYLIDKWRGQIDGKIYEPYQNEEMEFNVLFIPEQTTDQLQPLDTFFHRQLKLLVRNMYGHCKLFNSEDYSFMTTRNGNLMTQSLAHFVLKSPKFFGMIKHSWFKAGLLEDDVAFLTVKDVCFDFGNERCESPNCTNIGFIKCPWCESILCHIEFYREYHMMKCPESPYVSNESVIS